MNPLTLMVITAGSTLKGQGDLAQLQQGHWKVQLLTE